MLWFPLVQGERQSLSSPWVNSCRCLSSRCQQWSTLLPIGSLLDALPPVLGMMCLPRAGRGNPCAGGVDKTGCWCFSTCQLPLALAGCSGTLSISWCVACAGAGMEERKGKHLEI